MDMKKEQWEKIEKEFIEWRNSEGTCAILSEVADWWKIKLKKVRQETAKYERERISEDINSVLAMLNGTVKKEKISNYIKEYLK